MKKVIRLTESNLVDIVKKVISEQNYSEIKATTDPTRIAKLSVLTEAGLPADETNFRGRWVLEQPNIYKTFSTTKNLSLFKNLTPKSPADGENYIEMTVQRFLKNVLNPDKTVKVKGGPDQSTPPVVESLVNKGTKTFNVKYQDDKDPKYTWSLVKVVASGNGLLALSRALLESNGLPNKITIGMSQPTRESGGYQYNAAQIGKISPTLNLLSNMTVASILTKSGIVTSPTLKSYVSGDMPSVGSYFNKSNDDIAKLMAQSLYFFDVNFIPENQKETFNKKVDASGKPILPNYNSTPFLTILNGMPNFNNIQGLIDGDSPAQKWSNIKNDVITSYSKYNEQIRNEVITQYKKRLIAFFSYVYKDVNQATQLVNSTQFSTNTTKIEVAFENAVEGIKYLKSASISKAGETKTANTYDVGKSRPNQQK